jgi:hypothetical protein
MITDSNQAFFTKMSGYGLQEEINMGLKVSESSNPYFRSCSLPPLYLKDLPDLLDSVRFIQTLQGFSLSLRG